MSNMVVRTNIFSLNAHRNMKNVGLEQKRAANRLSSGYRINSAADDAAGLSISENMRAQIRSLDQGSRNAQDAQAMMLTAEGGLESISDAAQRVRELLIQASNDTNTNDQREMINQEIIQLGREISGAQHRVEFNASRVLAMGSPINVEISRGISILEVDNLRVSAAFRILDDMRDRAQTALTMVEELPSHALFEELSVRQQTIMNEAMEHVLFDANNVGSGIAPDVVGDAPIPHAIDEDGDPINPNLLDSEPWATDVLADPSPSVGDMREALLARISVINEIYTSLNNIRADMSNNSRLVFSAVDDFRDETSSGNYRAFFQVGPNATQGVMFDFEELSRAVAAAAATINTVTALVANPDNGSGIGRGVEVTHLIAEINVIVEEISSVRAGLGATQNRLDHTMRGLDVSSENLQDSESRVRNTDMAREMMRLTMSNVLQQASVSMLSQANQIPDNLLQVLR
ncbi:MAG: flagellin [Defluviitaleaceae bacterium]|nr:flagellin [Defluviitaleaceae bacterium]